jgi:hypothetical protein
MEVNIMTGKVSKNTETYNFGELLATVATESALTTGRINNGKKENIVHILNADGMKMTEHENQFGLSTRINAVLIATNDDEAKEYEGTEVSFFLSGGRLKNFLKAVGTEPTTGEVRLFNTATIKLKTGKDYIPLEVRLINGGAE